MKRLLPWIVATLTLCSSAPLLLGEEMLPGQVDFGRFDPPKGDGQFVEVNVPSDVISLASHFVEREDPDVSKVLDGLKLVHINVIGLDDQNRSELQERAQKLRSDLSDKGWAQIVTVQEKGQNVGVYLKTADKNTIQGLVVTVLSDKDQAVFVNVVGNIKPEQLAMLGDKLNIDPLKKLHLKEKNTDEKQEKSDGQ